MDLVRTIVDDVGQLVRGLLGVVGIKSPRAPAPVPGGVVGLGRSQVMPDDGPPPDPTSDPAEGAAGDRVREAKGDLGRNNNRPPVPVKPMPAFSDRGTVARLPTIDDGTRSIDKKIIADVPGAAQFFGVLGFSLDSHENAAGLSRQQLDYVEGSSEIRQIVSGQIQVPSVVLRDAINGTIDRLAAVEHVDASKRTELIPGLASSDAVTVGGIRGGPSLAEAAATADAPGDGVPGSGRINFRAETRE